MSKQCTVQRLSNLCLYILIAMFAALMPSMAVAADKDREDGKGKIVVANRDTGTISVINVGKDRVVDTVPLPILEGDNQPEPMYVVNTPKKNRVWVSDRANDRVVVFHGNNFELETTVPCGQGVFHLAADQVGRQVWVVNDIDKTATVIDANNLNVLATVDMPEDLGAPHDVVLDSHGVFAYVTFLADDTVVQFETLTFSEVDRAVVGISPHVAYNSKSDELYLPCQLSNAIFVLDAVDLSPVDIIPVPNAHGTIMSTNSKRFYTTNIAEGGANAIYCIDTTTNTVLDVADTPEAVPHNVALTPNGKKLYVTHSGSNNKVSVFEIKRDQLRFLKTIEVGDNPFGLAHVR